MIKARISAEMEAQLGEDAWAAQLLARLLQVHASRPWLPIYIHTHIYTYIYVYIYIYIYIYIYYIYIYIYIYIHIYIYI